jgi:hypothetical protein
MRSSKSKSMRPCSVPGYELPPPNRMWFAKVQSALVRCTNPGSTTGDRRAGFGRKLAEAVLVRRGLLGSVPCQHDTVAPQLENLDSGS